MAVGKSVGDSAGRYSRLSSNKQSTDFASWEDAEPDDLWRTITAIVNAGDAVTIGRTRDGGALSLVILSGDERIRKYARGEHEVKELLAEIRASLEATD